MRTIALEDRDIFRPRGQLKEEIDFAECHPDVVINTLGRRLSAERRQRIESVISHRTRRLEIAMDGLVDPHNTAAVIRTADAFGLQVVHVVGGKTQFVSSRKVTQGAHKWVDIARWKSPGKFAEAMHMQGKKIVIAAADAPTGIHELEIHGPTVVVLGNEHEGVSTELRKQGDIAFRIPMYGFVDSINVSAAAAVTLATLRSDGQGDLSPQQRKILRARFYLRAVRAGLDIVILEQTRKSGANPGLLE